MGKHLNQAGYSVIIPLIPDYGMARGQCSQFEVAPSTQWLQCASAYLDELKLQYHTVSVRRLCIGAVLALAQAGTRSDDIAALPLLSTTLACDGWSIPRYRFLLPLVYHTPFRRSYGYRERYPYGLKNARLRRWVEEQMAQCDATHGPARNRSGQSPTRHRLPGECAARAYRHRRFDTRREHPTPGWQRAAQGRRSSPRMVHQAWR